MKLKIYFPILLVLFIAGLHSCAVDLAHINSFSKTAVGAIGTYKDAGYSFTYSYYHFTQTSNIYKIGDKAPKTIFIPAPNTTANEPETAIKADAVVGIFMASISSYFEGISKISDKDLVNYNFDNVGKNLKADKALKSKLNLEDAKIDAFTSIAKVFTNEMMGTYRESKVKSIMIKYNDSLSLLMQ
jgi:hypothetical protein